MVKCQNLRHRHTHIQQQKGGQNRKQSQGTERKESKLGKARAEID